MAIAVTRSKPKPVKVLIAALGGEGGGVLAAWLNAAAIASDHYVQSTSIPGVAQRTGATTYYLEIVPGDAHAHNVAGPRPVLALNAAPGEVDIVVASEMLEATRAIQAGFVTPDRTLLIASTARVFTVDEKSAMSDGRLDPERMQALIQRFARCAVLADFATVARDANSQLNAVLLGAIAGAGVLPMAADAFRSAIRAEAKSVEANLRGFAAGQALADRPGAGRSEPASRPAVDPPAASASAPPPPGTMDLSAYPADARPIIAEGVRRLADYQDEALARRYLERLDRFIALPSIDAPFMRELARHLAVRMSVEDVIRVAQLKLRETRIDRVTREAAAGIGDIVDITEFLKPGPEEIFGLLPRRLGRWALQRVRPDRAWPLKVSTTRLSGFLRLRALAALKRWRPRTLRFAEEDAWVERWLDLIARAVAADTGAAREIVASAALVRGYGDTYKRGLENWTSIMHRVAEPMLAGTLPRNLFADALLQARLAASKDPEGSTLDNTLAAIAAVKPTPGQIAAE